MAGLLIVAKVMRLRPKDVGHAGNRSHSFDIPGDGVAMVTGATFDAIERENWFPLRRVAEELMMQVEAVRVSAEMELDLDVYDPELDMVSERGRQQIRSLFEL